MHLPFLNTSGGLVIKPSIHPFLHWSKVLLADLELCGCNPQWPAICSLGVLALCPFFADVFSYLFYVGDGMRGDPSPAYSPGLPFSSRSNPESFRLVTYHQDFFAFFPLCDIRSEYCDPGRHPPRWTRSVPEFQVFPPADFFVYCVTRKPRPSPFPNKVSPVETELPFPSGTPFIGYLFFFSVMPWFLPDVSLLYIIDQRDPSTDFLEP